METAHTFSFSKKSIKVCTTFGWQPGYWHHQRRVTVTQELGLIRPPLTTLIGHQQPDSLVNKSASCDTWTRGVCGLVNERGEVRSNRCSSPAGGAHREKAQSDGAAAAYLTHLNIYRHTPTHSLASSTHTFTYLQRSFADIEEPLLKKPSKTKDRMDASQLFLLLLFYGYMQKVSRLSFTLAILFLYFKRKTACHN